MQSRGKALKQSPLVSYWYSSVNARLSYFPIYPSGQGTARHPRHGCQQCRVQRSSGPGRHRIVAHRPATGDRRFPDGFRSSFHRKSALNKRVPPFGTVIVSNEWRFKPYAQRIDVSRSCRMSSRFQRDYEPASSAWWLGQIRNKCKHS